MCGRIDQRDVSSLIADFSWAESALAVGSGRQRQRGAGLYKPVLQSRASSLS